MKKSLAALLAVILLLSLSACAKKTKLEEIQSRGTLVVYTDPNFSPFEFIGGNEEVVGVDIEIAKAIAAELGVKIEIKQSDFDGLVLSLKGGRGDVVISGMTIREDRRENVDFSVPYIDSVQYLILPEGSEITVLEDLAGKNVGVAIGYTGQFLLEDELHEKVNEDEDDADGVLARTGTVVNQYKSALDATLDLKAGRIQAVVMDEYVAKNIVANNSGITTIPLNYADGSPVSEEYGVAVPKGNEAFVEKINTVIARLIAEGRIAEWVVQFSS
ncbi:MAG: transporter substrate-binding domain-containing protein [Oscillospiraceae bacterium]|jgi:polar amino acid transport system substrate-binding protein|nr:transporter substrate-binding domain-containing protein [Oscillospiraceae bacterium]